MMVGRILLMVMICAETVLAQAPEILWNRTYGGPELEELGWVEQANDSGWVMAGCTESFGVRYKDFYFLKILPNGDTAWSRIYGGDDTDVATDIRKTRDGGYIVCGWSGSYLPGARYHLMKLDGDGNFLWQRQFGADTASNYAFGVCQMADGGFLIAGDVYCHNVHGYDWDLFVVKTDSSGNLLNQYEIVKPGSQGGHHVTPTSDGGAIMVNGRAMLIVKFDANGDTMWSRGYSGVSVGNAIIELNEGGYMAFGYRDMSYNIADQFWLLRLGTAGDTLWTRYYGGVDPDEGYSFQRTWDGGYIMVGSMYPDNNPLDASVVRADIYGNQLWSTHFGNAWGDIAFAVQCTDDHGYLVAGETIVADGTLDLFFVRLGPDTMISAINDDGREQDPSKFKLYTNYPNPFNSTTIIEYSLQAPSEVTIDIYDISGRKVESLNQGYCQPGEHKTPWRAEGRRSGVYIYKINAGGYTETNKMVLLR